jgi:hypothetical protein
LGKPRQFSGDDCETLVHPQLHKISDAFIAEGTSTNAYLKSAYGSTLEAKICLEVLRNLTNKTLEWQLPDQQLGGLLVSSNFSKGHSTWPTRR